MIELPLLCVILAITALGQRKRWHGRWFETRRLAEYLRHRYRLCRNRELAGGVRQQADRGSCLGPCYQSTKLHLQAFACKSGHFRFQSKT